MSRKGAFAHEGSCRRGLASREGAFAHEGGFRRELVSRKGAFAYEGSCRRGLVSREGAFAHEGERQRALSQEIIREITSGEKVSSMFLYSETSPVTQCWKRWFRPSSARMTLLLLEGRPAFRAAIFLSHWT